MKRRKLPPDKRLNWRDPNMLVIRVGIVDGKSGVHEIEPKYIKIYYHNKMLISDYPDWKDDPTYFLKKLK